jgi:hypothetical protein
MLTISLIVVLHEEKWVEVEVTKESDVGPERTIRNKPAADDIWSLLHPPVILVLC